MAIFLVPSLLYPPNNVDVEDFDRTVLGADSGNETDFRGDLGVLGNHRKGRGVFWQGCLRVCRKSKVAAEYDAPPGGETDTEHMGMVQGLRVPRVAAGRCMACSG